VLHEGDGFVRKIPEVWSLVTSVAGGGNDTNKTSQNLELNYSFRCF